MSPDAVLFTKREGAQSTASNTTSLWHRTYHILVHHLPCIIAVPISYVSSVLEKLTIHRTLFQKRSFRRNSFDS